jgi:hypothetical protein
MTAFSGLISNYSKMLKTDLTQNKDATIAIFQRRNTK